MVSMRTRLSSARQITTRGPGRAGASPWAAGAVAHAIGIQTGSNALFAIAFGFVLVLLVHFSLVISRLTDQNKVLAQRLGLLEQRVDKQSQADAEAVEDGLRTPDEIARVN